MKISLISSHAFAYLLVSGTHGQRPAGKCSLEFGPTNSFKRGPRKPRLATLSLSQGCMEQDQNIEVVNVDQNFEFVAQRRSQTNGKYWTGKSQDGAELSIFEDKNGTKCGSFVNVEKKEITQFFEIDGTMVAETTHVDDFPEEGDIKEIVSAKGGNRFLQDSILDIHVKELKPSLRGVLDRVERDLQSKTVLDLLVVWTRKSECAWSQTCSSQSPITQTSMNNMFNLVNLAIQETNDAYTVSGVGAELRLVHVYRHPTYVETESGAFGNALSALRTQGDNIMDEVHSKRDEYGADLVVMIIDSSEFCGIGYLGPRDDLMFSVTAWNCATGYYSFGHEIGHNMGCFHDRGTEAQCPDTNFYYGFRDPNARFRDIMAYNCVSGQCDSNVGGGCTRVKMFSTPSYTYNGEAIGSSASDCARTISDVTATIANYRGTKTDCELGMTCSSSTGQCVCQTQNSCGDLVVEGTEKCDGSNFNTTCAAEGFPEGGKLACAGDCTVITKGCYKIVLVRSGLSSKKGGRINGNVAINYSTTFIGFNTSGANGDAALYIRFGSKPTLTSYDCVSDIYGSNEQCTFNGSNKIGVYYYMIYASSTFSGLSFKVVADGP